MGALCVHQVFVHALGVGVLSSLGLFGIQVKAVVLDLEREQQRIQVTGIWTDGLLELHPALRKQWSDQISLHLADLFKQDPALSLAQGIDLPLDNPLMQHLIVCQRAEHLAPFRIDGTLRCLRVKAAPLLLKLKGLLECTQDRAGVCSHSHSPSDVLCPRNLWISCSKKST